MYVPARPDIAFDWATDKEARLCIAMHTIRRAVAHAEADRCKDSLCDQLTRRRRRSRSASSQDADLEAAEVINLADRSLRSDESFIHCQNSTVKLNSGGALIASDAIGL